MPNGGVPIHMVLKPQSSDGQVIHSHAGEVRVVSKREWEQSGANGAATLSLTKAEALVLERFLRYWLHDKEDGPIYRQPGVDVLYDF